jgi:FkbM family methyltransferase
MPRDNPSSLLAAARSIAAALQTPNPEPPFWLRGAYAVGALPIQLALYGCVRAVSAFDAPLAVAAKTRDGCNLICDLPDSIQTCIFLYGVWEPDITAYISASLQPGDTFVDAGAHVGYYSVLASRAVESRGRVVAFEASSETFSALERNLALEPGRANVRAVNVAVAGEQGTVSFFPGPKGSEGLSTTVARSSVQGRTVASGTFTSLLTEAELRSARIIKIDVEGAEAEVLRGAIPALGFLRPDAEFVIELSPSLWPVESRQRNTTCEEVLAPLLDAGFLPYRVENDYAPWRFLYPERTSRPRRIRGPIRAHGLTGQIDLVLSRRDAASL